MSTYVVEVTLRHKSSRRTFATWVSVSAPFDAPDEACLIAAQLGVTHRESWTPISTRIVEMEA